MNSTTIEKHFDKVAKNYDIGKQKYSYYYKNLKKLLKSLIPENKNVLEIGCGTGDLLVSLRPKEGYGMDVSGEMIKRASKKHKLEKKIKFSTIWPSNNSNHFDYIFMSDVIEHLENPEETFRSISKIMGKNSIFINTMANPSWEPLLMFWERLGWKMKEGPHFRLSTDNLKLIINNSNLKVIEHNYKLLIPVKIPFITNFANKYLENPLKKIAFIEYLVAVRS